MGEEAEGITQTDFRSLEKSLCRPCHAAMVPCLK